MKALVVPFLFLFSLILFLSCNEDSFMSDQFESESVETQIIALASQNNFRVDDTNGSIIISSSDTAKNIYYNITKKVKSKVSEDDARAHLEKIIIAASKSDDDVTIKVDHPKNDNRNYEIKFGILLPDRFNYILNLGNGGVSIKTAAQNVIVNLGNGNTEADINLIDTCNVSISIGNGNLNLTLPANTNASVHALVGNGIVNNNGLNFQNQQANEKQLTGELGNGAGKIVLNVGNGSITLLKK